MKTFIVTALALVMISGAGLGTVQAEQHRGDRDRGDTYEEKKPDRDRGEKMRQIIDGWYADHEVPEDVRSELRENHESMRETHRQLMRAHRAFRHAIRVGETERAEELAGRIGALVERSHLQRIEQSRFIRESVGTEAHRDLLQRMQDQMRSFHTPGNGDREHWDRRDRDQNGERYDRRDRKQESDGNRRNRP